MAKVTAYREGTISVSKITVVLEILSDGKWHTMDELLQSLCLSEHKLQELTSFLNAYSFVKFDEKNGRVKIKSDFNKLLSQTAIG